MSLRGLLLALSVAASLAFAADTEAVKQAARRADETAAKAPGAMAMEFRLLAAQSLQQRHAEMARQFVDTTLQELRSAKDPAIGSSLVLALAAAAPADATALIPKIAPRSTPALISALVRADHGAEAAKIFQELLAATHFDSLEPNDAWSLINTANFVATAAPALAADAYEGVLKAIAAPEYGQKSDSILKATFQIGSASVATDSSRDTLLVAAGSRLRALAPDRFNQFRELLAKWDLSAPATLRGLTVKMPGTTAPQRAGPAAETADIQNGMRQMRGLATDADRAKLVIQLVAGIRALPAGALKLSLAASLCNLATEGDLGKEALNGVASALAKALSETPGTASNYVELAKLVRYEHVAAPPADTALEAAGALLALRDQILQETGFTLPGLDGKTYNLDGLRGKVVLLNFWATWCPPCRKEMPDMEKLYQRFSKQGLIVLAVSDEESETVINFLKKQNYTFPVLLDPGRKVNTAFNVEGIPKSFLFDRQGKLVAQAIDMRTESQFLEMFKSAGIE